LKKLAVHDKSTCIDRIDRNPGGLRSKEDKNVENIVQFIYLQVRTERFI